RSPRAEAAVPSRGTTIRANGHTVRAEPTTSAASEARRRESNCHREDKRDVAIPERPYGFPFATGSGAVGCFVTLLLAMTAVLFVESAHGAHSKATAGNDL
ncbi:MAG: hypothetical protein ACXWC3_12720, partial [Burkholderiales bacterium]